MDKPTGLINQLRGLYYNIPAAVAACRLDTAPVDAATGALPTALQYQQATCIAFNAAKIT